MYKKQAKDRLTYKCSFLLTKSQGTDLDNYCEKNQIVKSRFVAAAIRYAMTMEPNELIKSISTN